MELGATKVASYQSLQSEPDTSEFNAWVIATGRTLLLPRIENDDLVFASGEVALGAFGIQEPSGAAVNLNSLDLILVPALAIDASGNRLGKGKGFYDRALAKIECPKFAVIFDAEYLESLPTESHDQKVDGAISPSAINYFRN